MHLSRSRTQATDRPSQARLAGECLLLAVAYVATARIGQSFAIPPGNVTSVWIPSGLVLAAMLLREGRLWPGVFFGALAGNAWAYFDTGSAGAVAAASISGVSNGVGDALGSYLGARLLLRRTRVEGMFSRLDSVADFLLYAVALSSLVSAVFGVGSLTLVGLVELPQAPLTALTWFLGDAMGVLLLTPALLVWVGPGLSRLPSPVESVAFLVTLGLVAAICLGLLLPGLAFRPPLFVLMPLFMWAVLRIDPRVTFPALVGVAAMSVVATAAGKGPFSGNALPFALLVLQLFLGVMSATVLVFLGVVGQERAHERAVQTLNAELEGRVVRRTRQLETELAARLAAEEAQAHLERQVLHAQKLESLGVLAGGIAHDFSNMLTIIMANAELALMTTDPDERTRAHFEEILDVAQRSSALTQQMLAYSGRGAFVFNQLDLGEHLRDMREILRVAAGGKATIEIETAPALPLVRADPAQLDQLVMNLVINAAEAMEDCEERVGGGRIHIALTAREAGPTDITAAAPGTTPPSGRCLSLKVQDAGCGMAADDIARIFDPFFTTKATGRGLGMAVVLGIVRGHKGTVLVSSAVGEGTTFEVLLPAASSPEAAT